MQQIKIFKGSEFELEKLEQHVNKWMRDARIRPINIFGNIAPQSGKAQEDQLASAHPPSDIILVLVYEHLEAKA